MRNANRARLILPLALVGLLGLEAGAEAGAGLRRYAVVIGSNHGGAGRVTLRYAGSDAEAVARVLGELGGVRSGDIALVREPDARQLDRAFARVSRRIREQRRPGQRVELVVYYSGHADEQGLLLAGQRYDYARLRRQIRRVPADVQIAIVDSCASGSFTRVKGGSRRPAFLRDESNKVKGHAFLSSSSADESAQESDRIGASFFTHFLVAALRGAADRNRDGVVTLTEAYQFAYEQTVGRTQNTAFGAQHPAYDMQLSGAGNIVITDLRSTDSVLVLPEKLAGRITVADPDGRVAVELTKDAGEPMSLALPSETYTVHVEHHGDRFVATVTLKSTAEITLSTRDLEPASAEATVARGDAGVSDEDEDDDEHHGVLDDVEVSFGGGVRLELPGEEGTGLDAIVSVGGASREVEGGDLVGLASTAELFLGVGIGDGTGFAYDVSLGIGPGIMLSDELQLGATAGFGLGGITNDHLDFAWKLPTELFAALEIGRTTRAIAYFRQTYLYKSEARQNGSKLARWGDQSEAGAGLRFTGRRKGFLYGSLREMAGDRFWGGGIGAVF